MHSYIENNVWAGVAISLFAHESVILVIISRAVKQKGKLTEISSKCKKRFVVTVHKLFHFWHDMNTRKVLKLRIICHAQTCENRLGLVNTWFYYVRQTREIYQILRRVWPFWQNTLDFEFDRHRTLKSLINIFWIDLSMSRRLHLRNRTGSFHQH